MHANHLSNTWSVERVDLAVSMWNAGRSAGEIAKRLGGVSRNAVIGKIHRLDARPPEGITIKRKPVPKKYGQPPQPKARRKRADRKLLAPMFAVAPLPPEPPKPDKLVSLSNLEDNQCRFPFGDPKTAEFGYCGCETLPGSRYCPGHHGVCFTAPKPVERPLRANVRRVVRFRDYTTVLKEVAF